MENQENEQPEIESGQDIVAQEISDAVTPPVAPPPADPDDAVGVAAPVDDGEPEETGTRLLANTNAESNAEALAENEVEVSDQPDVEPLPTRAPTEKEKDQLTVAIHRFAACGRCSFFLSGYRALYGDTSLLFTVARNPTGWLSLNWAMPMRELVSKSYGVQMYIDYIRYDACCPECQRPFIYKQAQEEGEKDSFRIRL